MKFTGILKENVIKGLKGFGKLRVNVNHSSLVTFSVLLLILFVAFTIRVLPLRWEIPKGSLHLSEFDPYYQYTLTNYMVENGLFSPYWPTQWVDTQRWYPDGINMAKSLSSLPMTTAVSYNIVAALGINIDLMSFCALIPAIFGTLSVLVLYFLGKDIGGKPVGMLAALLLALNPSYIQRSKLGFFDTETVGLFSLVLFSFLFLRAIEGERSFNSTLKYSLGSALALAYFITGWGAAYYIVGLTVLFVFVLILLKRYTRRLFLAYSITFGLGLLLAINNPSVTSAYLTKSFILPVAGVFILLCVNEIMRNLTSARNKFLVAILILVALIGSFAALWASGYIGDVAGKFLTVLDPFLRSADPLVESVAEHRISAWGSIYFDLGIGLLFFVVGLFFAARNIVTRNLFLVIFGLTALYFASSMVRLLVIFAPAYGLLAAVGVVGLLKPFVALLREPPRITKKKFRLERVGKEFSGIAVFLIFLILMTNLAISPQTAGLPNVYRQVYQPVTISAGSLSVIPSEPVSQWLDMLEYLNNFEDSTVVVVSWWDYGYWLSVLGNVTSLADNATINATQIENIGFSFMANETYSMNMLKQYGAEYILVYTTFDLNGNWIDFAGGDNGKWTWMARISGAARDRFVETGLIDSNSSWTDQFSFGSFNNETNRWEWNDVGRNSTVYKLMSSAKNRWCISNQVSDPDQALVSEPGYFVEEFFSGKNLSPSDASVKYGGLVPLVALYKIDWQSYESDYPNT